MHNVFLGGSFFFVPFRVPKIFIYNIHQNPCVRVQAHYLAFVSFISQAVFLQRPSQVVFCCLGLGM